uniref:Putative secreted protein n=1 Tax=Anopheles triannulatus TaxID=58253 RepID=A0A2M4B0J7_9DIPT
MADKALLSLLVKLLLSAVALAGLEHWKEKATNAISMPRLTYSLAWSPIDHTPLHASRTRLTGRMLVALGHLTVQSGTADARRHGITESTHGTIVSEAQILDARPAAGTRCRRREDDAIVRRVLYAAGRLQDLALAVLSVVLQLA